MLSLTLLLYFTSLKSIQSPKFWSSTLKDHSQWLQCMHPWCIQSRGGCLECCAPKFLTSGSQRMLLSLTGTMQKTSFKQAVSNAYLGFVSNKIGNQIWSKFLYLWHMFLIRTVILLLFFQIIWNKHVNFFKSQQGGLG